MLIGDIGGVTRSYMIGGVGVLRAGSLTIGGIGGGDLGSTSMSSTAIGGGDLGSTSMSSMVIALPFPAAIKNSE